MRGVSSRHCRALRVGVGSVLLLGSAARSVEAWGGDGPVLAAQEAAGKRAVEEVSLPAVTPRVFQGGVVWTAAGDRFEPGYVVVDASGRIAAVGEGVAPVIDGATPVDTKGRHLTPGLIDTHSHLGVYPAPGGKAHADGNEMTSPTTPGVWAEHSVWPQDPHFEKAVAGGITTLQILPGSGNLIGGRGVVMRPVPTRGSRAMRFPGAPETVKMACGENPKRVYGQRQQAPSTRMGNVRAHRDAFLGAQDWLEKWEKYETKQAAYDTWKALPERKQKKDKKTKPDVPRRDLNKETLALVLTGQALPQIHCYRADDMLSMLQIADEFGFEIRSFHHALEAYKIADILAEKEVAVSTWPDWWGFKLEAYDGIQENLAMVHVAGGHAVVHSDSSTTIRRLNQEAAKALATGRRAGFEVDENDALSWVTLQPAWALGIQDETGSLEAGKRADLVVWDADPLSVYSKPVEVVIDGRTVWTPDGPLWSDYARGQLLNDDAPQPEVPR